MSWTDRVKGWFSEESVEPQGIYGGEGEVGRVIEALRTVVDPELNEDIVHLGMVRSVQIDGTTVHLAITLTTAGCPLSDWLLAECARAITTIGFEAEVVVQTDPPWRREDIEG